MNSSASDGHFDVLIAGGGMVGASLACALAPLPLRMALVEAVPFDHAAQPSYDERTTVVSHGSQRIYATMGLWQALEPAATSIRRIHVSERGRFGVTRIDSREQGVDALGHVLPNRVLGRALTERLARLPNVTLFCPATLDDVVMQADTVRATLGGGAVSARLLVGADGARSRVRAALGIDAIETDYRQQAVIATVTPTRPHPGLAFERFTPDGPMALLPVDSDRYALIWTLPPAEAEAVIALSEAAFLARLQAAFGNRLGRFLRADGRSAHPLRRVLSERAWRGRGVLIGNAAHSLHPVAGQGFNLGLRDVAVLAELVADAVMMAGGDPGSDSVLQAYADWRQTDQARVSGFTDGLVHLFSNRLPGLGRLRSLGLLGLDMTPPAKRWLARRNMGADGRIPRLARGLSLTEQADA